MQSPIVGSQVLCRDRPCALHQPLTPSESSFAKKSEPCLQKDGFGQESLRMIKRVQSATTGLQILLFSATFNQAVIDFAKDVVGTEAHQASCK